MTSEIFKDFTVNDAIDIIKSMGKSPTEIVGDASRKTLNKANKNIQALNKKIEDLEKKLNQKLGEKDKINYQIENKYLEIHKLEEEMKNQ